MDFSEDKQVPLAGTSIFDEYQPQTDVKKVRDSMTQQDFDNYMLNHKKIMQIFKVKENEKPEIDKSVALTGEFAPSHRSPSNKNASRKLLQ